MAQRVRASGNAWRHGWKAACVAVFVVLPLLPATRVQAVAHPVQLYIFAGQSNMVGYSTESTKLPAADPTLSAPKSNVRFWGPVEDYAARWTTLQAPTEILQTASHSGFGPEISAAAL